MCMSGWVLVDDEDIRGIKHSTLPPLPSLNKYGTTHTHTHKPNHSIVVRLQQYSMKTVHQDQLDIFPPHSGVSHLVMSNAYIKWK